MRAYGLAIGLSALALAGCHSQPAPPPIAAEAPPPRPGFAQGIDLPTDASDVLSELQGSRLAFVARYYRDPTSRWPTLTANEVRRLSALGLKIVAIWEWHSRDPNYFSYASGRNDALSAYRQAKAAGQPSGSAIYFAVDYNARGDDLQRVDQYFRGVAAGFATASGGQPEYKVGVYGSGLVCDAMRRTGLAQYAWLSNSRAWEGSADYAGWNIRQHTRFGNLSFSHDANEARDEYGEFQLANSENAAPSAPPPHN